MCGSIFDMERMKKILKAGIKAGMAGLALNAVSPEPVRAEAWQTTTTESVDLFNEEFFLRTYGDAKENIPAHAEFCRRVEEKCPTTNPDPGHHFEKKKGAPEDLIQLGDALQETRSNVELVPDAGGDYWQVAGEKGDCEDAALRMQQFLLDRGWNIHDLLIAQVFTPLPKNESHAVLVARTTQGDMFLDVLLDVIHTPQEMRDLGYRFVRMQSTQDARAWIALDPQYSTQNSALSW